MIRVHRPETLDETAALLAELDDAMVYGGGTAIQILRKQGLLFADDFVDVSRVEALRELSVTDGQILVGAMVSLRTMERDPGVREAAPLAAETYSTVANARVRNTASVAGNIAHGDYRLDPPTALCVLDAEVELTSVEGTRSLSIREFFTDFQATALEPGEFLSRVRVPRQPKGAVGAYTKLSSLSANDWPCASAAALAVPDGEDVEVRLGLGALAPTTVYLAFDATPDMDERAVVAAAVDIADSAMDPIADIRGSARYKAHLGRVAVTESVRRVLAGLPRAQRGAA